MHLKQLMKFKVLKLLVFKLIKEVKHCSFGLVTVNIKEEMNQNYFAVFQQIMARFKISLILNITK